MRSRTSLVLAVVGMLLIACGGGGGGVSGDAGPVPAIWSVSPDTGFVTGGALIRLRGARFMAEGAGTPRVLVGGTQAAGVQVIDDETLEFVLPAHLVGAADVDVTTEHGSDRLVDGLTYFGYPPTVEPTGVRIETDVPGVYESQEPSICCDGGMVYVAWVDARNGAGDIYFQRSTDSGFSWLAEDVRIDTDGAGASESLGPVLCCDGDRVVVVWEDERNGRLDIYANRSLDGGTTWLPVDQRLDTDPQGSARSEWPSVCCDGELVFAVWGDQRLGQSRIFCNTSVDGGATWASTDVRIDHNDDDTRPCYSPQAGYGADNVYVAWVDLRHGAIDIRFNRSTDSGRTWESSGRRLNSGSEGTGKATQAHLSCEGEQVCVVWVDQRDGTSMPGTHDIYFNRSPNHGLGWLMADQRINTDAAGAAFRTRPRVCCSGERVYVVWEDMRNGLPDIYARTSADGGATWLSDDRRLNTSAAGAEWSEHAQIVCDGPNAFAAWLELRAGTRGFYLNATPDGGLTWLASDLLAASAGSVVGSLGHWLACGGARAHLVWAWAPGGGELDVYVSTSFP